MDHLNHLDVDWTIFELEFRYLGCVLSTDLSVHIGKLTKLESNLCSRRDLRKKTNFSLAVTRDSANWIMTNAHKQMGIKNEEMIVYPAQNVAEKSRLWWFQLVERHYLSPFRGQHLTFNKQNWREAMTWSFTSGQEMKYCLFIFLVIATNS